MSAYKRDNIENLITRKLDGILSAEEDLELNRAMIRDPDSHTMCEETTRVDGLAAAALECALGQSNRELGFDPMELTNRHDQLRRSPWRRAWWLLPSSIAAGLAILVSIAPTLDTTAPLLAELDGATPNVYVAPTPAPPPLVRGSRQASHGPAVPRVHRDTVRDLIGVMGKDGNIYLIEVDRTRTIRRPDARYRASRASEDF